MIETEIRDLIKKEDGIKVLITKDYIRLLDMYGRVDATLGIYISMLFKAIKNPLIQETLKLELYKKLVTAIKRNNISMFVPDRCIRALPQHLKS